MTGSVWLVGLRNEEDTQFRSCLRGIVCSVGSVPSFEAARGLLVEHPPDVLVAPVRLGAFNGLHLAIVARVRASTVPAVVLIDEPEGGHEHDARQTDSHYLIRPVTGAELAGLVGRLARGNTKRRQAPRILAPKDAILSLGGSDDARVVEYSDGGLRLSVSSAMSSRLPKVFDVSTGQHEVTVGQAWHQRAGGLTHHGLWVYQESPSCTVHWRALRASLRASLRGNRA